ncbi:MAG TPA: DMT family transporter [Rhizomicrobium sp.]|jgi:drug/metabolite transporter (DMT)-like permease|nr:DMT family transporter [Rhizomicrobium sp.]
MKQPYLGIALKVSATLAFSIMSACIKLAGPVPVGEVIFFRCIFALVPLFALSVYTVGPRAVVQTSKPWLHVIRSTIGISSMFMGFSAIKMLPLADATAYSFVMPIFVVVLASLMLRETVGPVRGAAVVIGFAGVVLMTQAHGGLTAIIEAGFSAGSGLALTGAFLSAFVVIFIRQMSNSERSETIVFYFMTVSAVVSGITMIWEHVMPTPLVAFWLVMSGLLGGVGQICMTYSYRFAEPSMLAPFDYVAMVWAMALGFLIFGDVPAAVMLAGAGVVIAAGLFIVWREREMHREDLLVDPVQVDS